MGLFTFMALGATLIIQAFTTGMLVATYFNFKNKGDKE